MKWVGKETRQNDKRLTLQKGNSGRCKQVIRYFGNLLCQKKSKSRKALIISLLYLARSFDWYSHGPLKFIVFFVAKLLRDLSPNFLN